ncbi:hypothetical protein DFH29DRAFT_38704 [Suillus ampliporus]|nr:hypothetical protein DFH29DRAFT_38704 [Suillus ampliporus]
MSSSTQDLIPHLDLGSTFGALFIGVITAAVLFGFTNLQAFVYFQTHRDTGRTFYKLVVIWLWILDALHLALIVHCVYYYLVINYANIGALTEVVWSFKLQIILDVFIVYGVHLLYAYRIWIVTKGRSRALPIICHVITDLIKIEWSTYMTLGAITFLDVIIASSLCYILATSRTGFSSTDSLITKLMCYTINTGCLTSICSMTVMITCAVMPKNFIFLSIEFLLAKLYVNSFLALLNAPHYLQPNADAINSSEFRMRYGTYRPELHSIVSQDEELQASRKNMIKHPDDEMVHLPVQRSTEVMNPFSSM